MGAAVSSGGLRSVVATSSSTSLVQSSARFSAALSGVSFRDMHAYGYGYAGGRKARSGYVANSGMDGLEGGGAPAAAAAAVAGGDVSLEKSEPAGVERCDAHVELLTLIVGEDSTHKRQQLGSVLAWLLNKERAFASSLSKEHEVSQERAQPQPPLPDKGTTQQPLHVEKENLNEGDAKEKARFRDMLSDLNRHRSAWNIDPPQEVLDNLDAKEDTEEDKTEYTEGYYTDEDMYTMAGEIEQDREEDAEETTQHTEETTQQPLLVQKERFIHREYAPFPIKSYSKYDLKKVTRSYCNAVWARNSDESFLRLGIKDPGSYFQVGGPAIHRSMLEDFERNEIPEIGSGQVSRRRGWKKFLQDTPTLKSGLEHHAQWGPDVEKQVEQILELWQAVCEAATHAWKNGITYQLRFRKETTVHFDIGPLSSQQVAAIQCLGEYRRYIYVAVGEDGIPASFLGRERDRCVCTYCLAAGPDRKNLYTLDTRDPGESD